MKRKSNPTKSYNTNTATHDNGLFVRFDINTETKEMKYLEDIPKEEEQVLFAKLCSKMIPFWNSIKYTGLKELAEIFKLKSASKLSMKIVNLEKLNIIKRDNGYIYINPQYASRSASVKNSTLDIFNIKIRQEKSDIAVRTKVKKENIVDVEF